MALDDWEWLRWLLRERGRCEDEIDCEVDRQKAFIHRSLFLPDERWAHQVKAQAMGFGFVDLRRIFVDPSDMALIDPFLARQYRMAPVKRDGDNVWIALSDPWNGEAIAAARIATGCRVIPVVAIPNDLDDWLDRYYHLPDF